MSADDMAGNSGQLVEKVRARRRKTAWCTLAALGGLFVQGATVVGSTGTLALAAASLVGVGTAVEAVRRRQNQPAVPEQPPSFDEKSPLEDVVVAAAIAAKLGKADGMRLAGPIVGVDGGWTTVLQLAPGEKARKCLGLEGAYASALGVGESQVIFSLVNDHAGRLVIFVAASDPFLAVHPSPLVGRRTPIDFWAGIPAGRNGRGIEETIRIVEASLLVAGEPRAGKSAAVNGIIGAAALAVTPKIHLFDGKGAGDHRPWRKIAHTKVKRNAPALLAHLHKMQAQMERVFDLLDEHGGSTKLTPELCRRFGVDVELTIVDETRYYVTSPEGKDIVAAMVDIASRGPAAGVLLILATQRMTVDAIPGALKGVCSLRWAMRCPDVTASNAVLGEGAAGAGYNASEIPRSHRGVGILDADGEDPTKLRSYYLDDADLVAVADVAYELRRAAGMLPDEQDQAGDVDGQALEVLAVFDGRDAMHTHELVTALGPDWSPERIASVLKPLGLSATGLKISGVNRNGYRRADLESVLTT
ncbi:FtsK/SpoIIIE domain-containing protein [Nonomuraea maritima]|uniref:FtsK/SpoIIIE domain-containing protein n=1 Tax=Nonomuraea maritima TaxID=683260 RepID=UPI00371F9072